MPEMHFVDSSTVEAVGYDAESEELYVRFLQSGRTYVYYAVAQWVFDDFMTADSKGQYFHINIKGVFDYGEV